MAEGSHEWAGSYHCGKICFISFCTMFCGNDVNICSKTCNSKITVQTKSFITGFNSVRLLFAVADVPLKYILYNIVRISFSSLPRCRLQLFFSYTFSNFVVDGNGQKTLFFSFVTFYLFTSSMCQEIAAFSVLISASAHWSSFSPHFPKQEKSVTVFYLLW